MRRRWLIISAAILTIAFAFIAVLWFPPPKRITVQMTYANVTNKIAQWRPVRISSRGSPTDVRVEEEQADTVFIRTIFERGDPKFGPFTVVRVSKLDASTTAVEVSSTQYAFFSILGRRHVFFMERQRLKEMQELFHQ